MTKEKGLIPSSRLPKVLSPALLKASQTDPFCARIIGLRLQNKYTQAFVASILGVTRSAYSYYESGTSKPNYQSVRMLSDLYKVSIDSLLRGERSK